LEISKLDYFGPINGLGRKPSKMASEFPEKDWQRLIDDAPPLIQMFFLKENLTHFGS